MRLSSIIPRAACLACAVAAILGCLLLPTPWDSIFISTSLASAIWSLTLVLICMLRSLTEGATDLDKPSSALSISAAIILEMGYPASILAASLLLFFKAPPLFNEESLGNEDLCRNLSCPAAEHEDTSCGNDRAILMMTCIMAWAVRLMVFLLVRFIMFAQNYSHFSRCLKLRQALALGPFWFLTILVNGASGWVVLAFGNACRTGSTTISLSALDVCASCGVALGLAISLYADFERLACRRRRAIVGKSENPDTLERRSWQFRNEERPLLPVRTFKGDLPVNYIGEMITSWSIFIICVSALLDTSSDIAQEGWLAVVAPIHTTAALLFFAGLLPPGGVQSQRASWGLGAHLVVKGVWCS